MSSYNDFLSKIEVDEKELKRDLQNRSKEKKQVNKVGANPQGTKNPNSNKSLKKLPSSKKPTRNTNSIENLRNPNPKNINRDIAANKRNEPLKKEGNNAPKNIKRDDRGHVSNNKRQVNNIKPKAELSRVPHSSNIQPNTKKPNNVLRSDSNFSKQPLQKQKVHLRQKKVVDQFTKDKALVEKQTFSISKDEYDKKVMGTIRQQSTKMIFLKDGQKLAKVPKSVIFLGLYAFALSVVMLLSFSRVGTLKMELRNYNDKFKGLNEVNAQLNIKLATAYNIDNIRQRAENELYMSKPEAHQIMYITVVPENYVEYEMESDNE